MPESAANHSVQRHGTDRLGTTVWLTAQRNSRAQRTGRYLPESVAHPAKMLPAIAREAIERYTEPGDLVIDPMCGIGTTLVEASHLNRRGFGVEYEPRWAKIAERNLAHARGQGATGQALVMAGDARNIAEIAPKELRGTAALVITSPPYGASLHGQVRSSAETGKRGVRKFNYTYSRDRGNLAHLPLADLIEGFARILEGCATLLRLGGIVAVTARPWREHGALIDLPGEVITAGEIAGLEPVARCVALLAGIRDGRQIARPSFFQLNNVRKARDAGEPQSAIVHEDLILFQRGRLSGGSTGRASESADLPLLSADAAVDDADLSADACCASRAA